MAIASVAFSGSQLAHEFKRVRRSTWLALGKLPDPELSQRIHGLWVLRDREGQFIAEAGADGGILCDWASTVVL
jgi:hypothetical protein